MMSVPMMPEGEAKGLEALLSGVTGAGSNRLSIIL